MEYSLVINENLIEVMFGWPAILLSLFLALVGLIFKRPFLLLASGALIIPFSWSLGGFPAIRAPGIVLCLFQFGSAAAVWRNKLPLAWSLLLPMAIIAASLGYLILTH